MVAREANFDGLIGPTHNYGGLSEGNLASARNEGLEARPRDAALQGLEKMKSMADAGLVQGILPPHDRPFLPLLRDAGFEGSNEAVLSAAWAADPRLVRHASSASCMWAANAATVSPSADCRDGRLHFTPANLSTMLHRSIEAEQTALTLRRAFPDAAKFQVHDPLNRHSAFSDEGAANHVRLCAQHGAPGVELFVFGRDGLDGEHAGKFPARQTRLACQAIALAHDLDLSRTRFLKQSQKAIDAGAFHNDVVCVGALSTLFFHELAFDDVDDVKREITQAADGLFEPQFVDVKNADVPIEDAINSYLFNSMLVQMPGDDRLTLIAPTETRENARAGAFCDSMVAGNGPIGNVIYVDVRQSMRNGGGPACLRLRVALTDAELAATNPSMLLSDETYGVLTKWVTKHYRETLSPNDLSDPLLMRESQAALDELTVILNLGSDFYPFQSV